MEYSDKIIEGRPVTEEMLQRTGEAIALTLDMRATSDADYRDELALRLLENLREIQLACEPLR